MVHGKYEQERGAGGDIFVFVLTKKNGNTQSSKHLQKRIIFALSLKTEKRFL